MASIIIPVPEIKRFEKKIRNNLKKIKNVKVYLVEGKNPSLQRNEAIKKIKDEIIYFLDDDSLPEKENIKKAVEIFKKDKKIAIVGGPAIQTKFYSFWQKIFNFIFSCFFATGKSSSRYKRVGQIRETDEKEIILCNMFAKREVFIKLGGFKDDLYPNEENEFLNRIKKSGYKIIYSPDIYVERPHRKNLLEFIIQCFRYGKGRAEQIFFGFFKSDLINLIPIFFVIYILSLFFIKNVLYLIPLFLYFILNSFFSIKNAFLMKNMLYFPIFFICFFLLHIFYGLGFLAGVFFKIFNIKKKMNKIIKIKKIKL